MNFLYARLLNYFYIIFGLRCLGLPNHLRLVLFVCSCDRVLHVISVRTFGYYFPIEIFVRVFLGYVSLFLSNVNNY